MDSVDEDLEPTGGQATPALHKSAELAGYARTFLLGSALPVETREELEATSLPPVCCQAALGWRSCAFAGRGEREIGGWGTPRVLQSFPTGTIPWISH